MIFLETSNDPTAGTTPVEAIEPDTVDRAPEGTGGCEGGVFCTAAVDSCEEADDDAACAHDSGGAWARFVNNVPLPTADDICSE